MIKMEEYLFRMMMVFEKPRLMSYDTPSSMDF